MRKITPCLWFDGQAEQAADFYTSVFPNSKITHVMRYGPAGPGPEGSVVLVEFELDGNAFTGLNGGPQFTFSEAVSFQIPCRTQEEVDHYWDRLTEGGEESQCGWLKDRFGLSWQVVASPIMELLSDPDPGRAERATREMLAQRRPDISAVRLAADSVPAER